MVRTNDLSIVIFGVGSIGQRHIRNLKSLGVSKVYIYDPNSDLVDEVSEKHEVMPVSKNDIWSNKYDVAFITNPNSLHLDTALEAAKHGCHLLIEKPLATSMEGLEELIDLVRERDLITIVGCNMRFHSGPKKVKQLLEERTIGRILSGYVTAGHFLPFWKPGQDYKQSYSARKDLGGGCVLDGIHEIDLVCWYFGIPEDVKSYVFNTGVLGIEVEDTSDILMKFEEGFSCYVHIDYLQQTYERKCRIIGEKGTIWWDINKQEVTLYTAEDKTYVTYSHPVDYDINQMYIDEVRHFLDCISTGSQAANSVYAAREILEVALKAKGDSDFI
jgi:predicted dehydrogenase|tara:strand:+ start:425 stop:1414 length:990 start_codon:yes stop_codon:yes gene_type:complete